MNQKKPSSKQDVRAKVDSGLNKIKKNEPINKRPESGIHPYSGEKEIQSEQNYSIQRNIQDKMNMIVQDYLMRCNYSKTLEQFEDESQYQNDVNNQQEAKLLSLFDRGERDKFLKVWNENIPANLRDDHDVWKLEFYIQIYFLIYPIHPAFNSRGKMDKQSINAFKQFLDSKGSDLSKTNEALPYYALPYVEQPQNHQTFQSLFTKEWVQDLKDRLREYLSYIFQNDQGCQLQQLLLQCESQQQLQPINLQFENNTKEIKKINDQLQKNINENTELKTKLNQQIFAYQELNNNAQKNLTETQQKWFQLCRDMMILTKDLIKQFDQTPPNISKINILKKKFTQYEKFLSSDIDDLMNKSQDISLFEKASVADHEISNITSHQQIPTPIRKQEQQIDEYVPLNFGKIIQLFTKSTEFQLVATVLQALRLRITKAKNAFQRRQIVVAYSTHDIIGVHQKNILLAQYLILKAHPSIQCQSLKLINALASDYHGRTYLTSNPNLVKFLIDLIKKEQNDTVKRKNAIGALQKLSLRKLSQNYMLENNIIYISLSILKKERDSLSEYTYEYITALIMNLSLSSKGKDELTQNKELAFEVLYELIEFPNDQIRTFTNGTFYSLFSRKKLRDYAYTMGIPQELPKLLKNSDEKFEKQIKYMIDQLQTDEEDQDQSQMEEENDVDDLEDEDEECIGDDEEEDELENQNSVSGEELLQREFRLDGDEAEHQRLIMDSIILKEVQQRNAQQESIRESLVEKLNIGSQIPFYNEQSENKKQTRMQHNQKNNRGQQSSQLDPTAFEAKPKIPRTPPKKDY